MKRGFIALTLAFGFAAAPAFSTTCPELIAEVTEALRAAEASGELSESTLAQLRFTLDFTVSMYRPGGDERICINQMSWVRGVLGLTDDPPE